LLGPYLPPLSAHHHSAAEYRSAAQPNFISGRFAVHLLAGNPGGIAVGVGRHLTGAPPPKEVAAWSAKMPRQTVYVYNSTDGVLAWPGPLPISPAKEFIREFPNKYKQQGYYRTATGERIRPEDVQLVLLDLEWEPVQG
jgi:hypothetical protein